MIHVQEVSKTLGYPIDDFLLDGKFHRWDGKRKNKKSLWAVGNEWIFNGKDYWSASFGNWTDGSTYKIGSWETEGYYPNKEEMVFIRKKQKEISKQVEKEREIRSKECRVKWEPKFRESDYDPIGDYMLSKGLKNNYVGKNWFRGMFIIPVYSHKCFEGVQIISKEDDVYIKKFSTGIKKRGSFCTIGKSKIEKASTIYFAEGYSTACSIWEAIEKPVVCCFDCGNLLPVLKSFRKKYPEKSFVICADNDQYKDKNAGKDKAIDCCKRVSGSSYILPVFKNIDSKPTDFNDLHNLENLNVVKQQILKKDERKPYEKHKEMGFTDYDKTGKMRRKVTSLVLYFLDKHKSFYVPEIDTIYAWNGKYYDPMNESYVKNFVQQNYWPPCEKDHEAVEFVRMLKRFKLRNISTLEKRINKNVINFENGMFLWNEKKLIPHNPEYFCTHCLPVNYNQDALCPVWDDLMSLVTMDRPHIRSVIEEFFGYCMLGGPYDYNNILVLKGGGSNGKTTILNIMRQVLGDENCSAVSLAEVATNRFLTISMKHKLANFSEEEPKSVFKDTGILKRLSGKSPVKAEQKGKPVHMFENSAKLIMSYNEMPKLCDFSEGIKRRLLIIPFDIDLEENPHMKIDNLYEKMEKELPGIVNCALNGLHRLTIQSNFTRIAETLFEYERLEIESDPFLEWWEEFVDYKHDAINNNKGFPISKLRMAFADHTNQSISVQYFNKKISFIIKRAEKKGHVLLRNREWLGSKMERTLSGINFSEN